jgi:hypothetical protein
MSHSASKRDTPPSSDALEPLTEEQREAVRAWREGGMVDSPQVAALRKRARGEPLSDEERALLARTKRSCAGSRSGSVAADDRAVLSQRMWSALALDDWRRLPPDVQVAVAHAVERFPREGVVIATGPTECLLLVGAHAVVLLIERRHNSRRSRAAGVAQTAAFGSLPPACTSYPPAGGYVQLEAVTTGHVPDWAMHRAGGKQPSLTRATGRFRSRSCLSGRSRRGARVGPAPVPLVPLCACRGIG